MVLSFSDVGLMMTPSLMAPLIASLGGEWRRAYVVLAGVIAAMILSALALIRDRPQSVGLLPDGDSPEEAMQLRPAVEAGVAVDLDDLGGEVAGTPHPGDLVSIVS